MLNGLLVRDKTLHYFEGDASRKLLKKLNKNKTVYYNVERLSSERDRRRLTLSRTPKYQEFYLMTEDGKNKALV